ncbi:GNAT family N-acetyltransferase [Cryobacterium frigoriphilum]|uniref:Lysine N-acyltransferase MbtK n=1 Tax=Cryobacterium frigoriphilum TaxID=1259150 RepID=A0A4R8ZU24_9MICO|nr:GNAT family N-acetyltransferase [Cryobacterium frigoriphilum]TFD45603.1 GNAT family N-acetyltransferase [Cryobacterium frigoriphilum]
MTAPTFTFRPVDAEQDARLLHGWVTEERARFWGMLSATEVEVGAMYAQIAASPTHHALLGCRHGVPLFLMERYDPAADPIGALYPHRRGDVGMHLLVAPIAAGDAPIPGFTREIMRAVQAHLFADPTVRRLVVEPDVRNSRILALNTACGFERVSIVQLPDKLAWLSVCERDVTPSHLSPERWAAATRDLLRKTISEFSHERLLAPEHVGPVSVGPEHVGPEHVGPGHTGTAASDDYRITSDDGRSEYCFTATRRALNHWSIAGQSIRRRRDGEPAELDLLAFVTEFREQVGISDEVLPVYLEELSSTLASACYKLENSRTSAAQLATAPRAGEHPLDYGQRIERAMTEGHPCFVACNGRLGLGLADYRRFAPETGAPVTLDWLAVRRCHAVFTASAGLGYEHHLEAELDADTRHRFAAILADAGLAVTDYLLMPVHPWQWQHKLAITFAAEVARQNIVYLGSGTDRYQAQQSIRTFFNLDRPERCYVKTALSVLNMGFMRGLSPQYMRDTPAINDWLGTLVAGDPQLQRVGFGILREVAAIGYHNATFEAATPVGSPYGQMLSALWRESPLPHLEAGQVTATMASLLHLDHNGDAFVSALIAQSGLTPAAWLAAYLRAYLVPLVHCLAAYELAFMPHGENVILVLENGVPVRILMKDIAEEIVVMGQRMPLPPAAARIRIAVPAEEQVLTIFTDVFDCFFRFLAATLADEGQLPEQEFWRLVAETTSDYQAGAPEFATVFARHDLFAAEFPLSCLNRLQLRNNRKMLDLADPSASLQLAGTLVNPIARFRRPSVT